MVYFVEYDPSLFTYLSNKQQVYLLSCYGFTIPLLFVNHSDLIGYPDFRRKPITFEIKFLSIKCLSNQTLVK